MTGNGHHLPRETCRQRRELNTEAEFDASQQRVCLAKAEHIARERQRFKRIFRRVFVLGESAVLDADLRLGVHDRLVVRQHFLREPVRRPTMALVECARFHQRFKVPACHRLLERIHVGKHPEQDPHHFELRRGGRRLPLL